MRRLPALPLAALLAALLVPSGAVRAVPIPDPPPRVVVIVGPVGRLTDEYRHFADAAAAEARRFTPDVRRVSTPNATWPAVRQALQGASIVVYLGHGNGFPSPYGPTLRPGVQDGFGLNPSAGLDDAAVEHVGESMIASQVRLAPHAVVLLGHLCYASGNSEPGHPPPSLSDAVARADNYAAGFLAAGADAVVAESFGSLAPYVAARLAGRSIAPTWRSADWSNGHVRVVPSTRTPGASLALDPDRSSGGYHRSIVARVSLRGWTSQGPVPPGAGVDGLPAEPTLVGSGIVVGTPVLRGSTVAGTTARLELPLSAGPGDTRPADLALGVRWDPIDLRSWPPGRPSATVAPETLGRTVTVARAASGPDGVGVPVTLPEVPGRYRLVTTIHDPGGTAYDAATQALVPALLVRVTGPSAAAIVVAPTARAARAARLRLPVAVLNVGTTTWAIPQPADRRRPDGPIEAQDPARLVAHWIGVDGRALAPGPVVIGLPASIEPGQRVDVTLDLDVPDAAATWLLLLDVSVPETGSLAALGDGPTLVTVVVTEPPPAVEPPGR